MVPECEHTSASNGDPPPATKHKHRVKLWESFLQKTRKIRVRSKDKIPASDSNLHKRASSHPNISSFSSIPSISDSPDKVANFSNGLDVLLRQPDGDTADSRRGKYRQQRETTYTRSSVSLNDSACESCTPTTDKVISRISFRHDDSVGDDGYRSFHDRSLSFTNETTSSKLHDPASKEGTMDRSSGWNNADEKDADDEDDGEEQEENNDDYDATVTDERQLQVRRVSVFDNAICVSYLSFYSCNLFPVCSFFLSVSFELQYHSCLFR